MRKWHKSLSLGNHWEIAKVWRTMNRTKDTTTRLHAQLTLYPISHLLGPRSAGCVHTGEGALQARRVHGEHLVNV